MYFVVERFLTWETAILFIYCILALICTNSRIEENYFVYATTSDNNATQNPDEDEVILNPIIKNNPSLRVEEVSNGLDFPTSMAFLGPEDILVLEKNEGTVRRILNGELLEEPLLNVNVVNGGERGMLGIATAETDTSIEEDDNDNDNNHVTYVYLYYTESTGQDNDDVDREEVGNRLYRYELVQDKQELVNPKLLLDLPATPGPTHNGGKVAIGPDNNVYLTVGDIGEHDSSNPSTIVNNKSGPEPDGRAGILRVSQDGEAVQMTDGQGIELEEEDDSSGILGDGYPLNLYYAYGIRNSFGMDFDPVTGKLWDVETGRYFGEEVNLVEPGFNSGWMNAQGIWKLNSMLQAVGIASPGDGSFISQFVGFDGRGKYSSPEFTWGKMPVTTSGAAFFHSDRLGKLYENDLFVGDFVNGIIFDFDLSEDRMQLSFDSNGPLKDKLADKAEELEDIIFGYGFGGITDIKIGPYDGYLYVLSLDRGGDECKPQYPNRSCIPYSSTIEGHIFRIVPAVTQDKLFSLYQ
jgi:aldose sugar dehydrogenase